MRPIAIDLFAGAGGMSLGFEQAGFDVAAAVEIDPIHAAVHKFNFPETKVLARSVIGLSGDDIRTQAGIGARQVDVVIGGAPCQGFSLIGQRLLDDPRNQLVKEFVRIVGELEATHAVFENVKGLTVGPHRAFLEELIGEFERIGYEVTLPWRVLNAANYGVPQNRERLFLLASRKGRPLASYPAPLSGEQRVTVEDALGDLPDAESFQELLDRDSVDHVVFGQPSAYAAELRCLTPDSWKFGYERAWSKALLSSSLRTDHTEISRRRFMNTPEGTVEPVSRFFKLSANGVSNTLRAGTDSARGAFTSPRPIHYKYARCVTVREMMRLHGYPDWFRMHSTKWHGAREVGNSVPPPLARAVAREVLAVLDAQATKPTKTIFLGALGLLELDMSAAARLFSVEVNIGRRDRKSGVKKRTQHEIEAFLSAAE